MSARLHVRLLVRLKHQASLLSNFDHSQRYTYLPNNRLLAQLKILLYALWTIFNRPDIYNPHSRYDQVAFTLTKWLHRRPVIWKDPGDLIHQIKIERTGWLAQINQKLLIAAIKRADAIYTLNDDERMILLKRLEQLGSPVPAHTFTVIPSDIYFDDYDLEAKPQARQAKLVIGTVIQLHQQKGVQHLIDAFKRLNDKDLELWIVGDGPYRAELEKLAQDSDNIRFWGYQDNVAPFLNGMDIFVQPAEIEPWGRTIKEAMYFSKPIVGSKTGGIAAQLTHEKTGLLFEPGNVVALVEQLQRLINGEALREKLGRNAHKQAKKSGDYLNLMQNHILPLFEGFLKRPG